MVKSESIIGQNIICAGSGIGEIIGVTSLQEGGEEFYRVTFPAGKCVNYFSKSNTSNYRVLSSKKTINLAVKAFLGNVELIEYSSIHERINSQKEMLKENNIVKLAKILSLLDKEKDLHPQISKSFKDSLIMFIEEVAFVLNVSHSKLQTMLSLRTPLEKLKK